jgi:hypothetical protein
MREDATPAAGQRLRVHPPDRHHRQILLGAVTLHYTSVDATDEQAGRSTGTAIR